MTQTVEALRDRPVANAFGMSVSAIAIVGFGRSACTQRRSTSAWRPGASDGEASCAPIARRASLSDRNSCDEREPGDDEQHHDRAHPGPHQHADEPEVEQPEQQHRQEHPGLEAEVAPVRGPGRRHVPSVPRRGPSDHPVPAVSAVAFGR